MKKIELIVLAPARPPSGELAERVAALLVKADHEAVVAIDDEGLYGDLFVRTPDEWPAAALTRQFDAGDGAEHAWLRADPAHFRVEPGAVRLLACGDLGQDRAETDALLSTLGPVFGDEGFELSAPHPSRWYLRSFSHNAAPDLPALPPPEAARGGDLFELWPEDDVHRRWRRIFSEAQILLARHAVNEARSRSGRPAINGLWFWGAGRLPRRVQAGRLTSIVSAEPLLSALAHAAGVALRDDWPQDQAGTTILLDLRHCTDTAERLEDLLSQWRSGRLESIHWRAPNARWTLKRSHRWRFWRR